MAETSKRAGTRLPAAEAGAEHEALPVPPLAEQFGTLEVVSEARPVVKPVGPRGATTTEWLVLLAGAALLVVVMVALLIFSPDPATRKTISDYMTKLVVLAVGYIVSRGAAKFGQGVIGTFRGND